MKAYIRLNREGIPTVRSEEGWTLVDEEGVISFKRRKKENITVECELERNLK